MLPESLLAQLEAAVTAATADELPRLVGALEAAKAAAWARLATPAPRNTAEAADRVLSMGEVASRLGVSLYTAREMGRRGELPVTTLGRRVGVRDSSLRRFLDLRERGGRKG